jgi:hypothetical protein
LGRTSAATDAVGHRALDPLGRAAQRAPETGFARQMATPVCRNETKNFNILLSAIAYVMSRIGVTVSGLPWFLTDRQR